VSAPTRPAPRTPWPATRAGRAVRCRSCCVGVRSRGGRWASATGRPTLAPPPGIGARPAAPPERPGEPRRRTPPSRTRAAIRSGPSSPPWSNTVTATGPTGDAAASTAAPNATATGRRRHSATPPTNWASSSELKTQAPIQRPWPLGGTLASKSRANQSVSGAANAAATNRPPLEFRPSFMDSPPLQHRVPGGAHASARTAGRRPPPPPAGRTRGAHAGTPGPARVAAKGLVRPRERGARWTRRRRRAVGCCPRPKRVATRRPTQTARPGTSQRAAQPPASFRSGSTSSASPPPAGAHRGGSSRRRPAGNPRGPSGFRLRRRRGGT